MTLYLFNSDGQKLEPFEPRHDKQVRMYCCGPTVYNYAHIGNLRAYTIQDVLRRVLLSLGYELSHVMNITDVGHLTDDGDNGEDKMLVSAKAKGKNVYEIAEYYTQAFFADCQAMRIERPETVCRASQHIQDIQQLIQQIEAAGYTYYKAGNLYFDTGKLQDYGRLAQLQEIPEAEKHSRTGIDMAKKNQRDFVLWFSNSKFSDQAMQWDSPWGRGYPGWHIECSAMACRFLGSQIDIHCGGIDHKTVHHPNEMAQSESTLAPEEKPWVRFWLHNEFVLMPNNANGDKKISKSSGSAINLASLEEVGFSPLDYRYFLLGSHYRNQVQFHFQALQGAQTGRKRLQQKALELRQSLKSSPELAPTQAKATTKQLAEKKHVEPLFSALLQDLNTPQALACLWDSLKSPELSAQQKLEILKFGESILQIGLFDEPSAGAPNSEIAVPAEFSALLTERNRARKAKDYARADEIRKELQDAGYQIVDTAEGSVLKKHATST